MNLPVETTGVELPPPVAPAPPTPKRHRWPIIVAAVGTVAGVAAIVMAINGDNDLETIVAQRTATTEAQAAPASDSAGATGDSAVDTQIIDMVWENTGKASICPSLNELKASMPNTSAEELVDMGMAAAGSGMDELTAGQIARLRELALTDC